MLGLKMKPKTKEKKLTLKLPIVSVDDLIETQDKSFVLCLKVTDTINTDLLADTDLLNAVTSIQDCCNSLQSKAQILISSERIDIEQYLEDLEGKAKQSKDMYTLDRIKAKIEYLRDRSLSDNTVLNFYLSVKSQFSKVSDALDELNDISKAFQEYLQAADMHIEPLTEREALKVLYEKLNPTTSILEPFTNDMTIQSINTNHIKDYGKYLEMDDMYYSFYTFSYLPEEVNAAWLKRVMNVRANIDLSICFDPTDKTKIIKDTNNRVESIEMKLMGKLPTATKKKYEHQQRSLEKLLDELQNDSENIFDIVFVIALREKSLEDLATAEKRLRTAISSSKLRSRKLVHKGQFLFWYTLPICYTNKDFESKISWSMQSSTIASILPFDSSELQQNTGILKGFHATKEAPIIYDRYDRKAFNNSNEIVLGEPGSGKSFYLKVDMHRESTSGRANRLFVIDPEREYFLPNANRTVFKLGSEFTTNPFHIRSTVIDSDNDQEDGKSDVGQYLRRKIGETMSFFKWIIPSIDDVPEQKSRLIQAVTHAYSQKGLNFESTQLPKIFPILTDLKSSLNELFGEDAAWLINSMYAFIDGPYASMFNGQTNWDFNSKINVMDIHEITDDIKKPLMDLLIKDIWEEIKIDREELKGLYVDETWLLADENNPQTMAFLREIAKRIRKYGGFLTTATQNVDDFLSVGKYGAALLKNAHFKTFMRMDEKDIDELKRFMSFSEKELKILGMKKGKGRCIHIASAKRIEMQTKASPDELAIVDPKQFKELQLA